MRKTLYVSGLRTDHLLLFGLAWDLPSSLLLGSYSALAVTCCHHHSGCTTLSTLSALSPLVGTTVITAFAQRSTAREGLPHHAFQLTPVSRLADPRR